MENGPVHPRKFSQLASVPIRSARKCWIILPPEVFRDVYNAPNSFSAPDAAEKLMTLPTDL